jgi:hypothetical protein
MATNKGTDWWKLWLWVASVFVATSWYSWANYDGDISFGKLKKKGLGDPPDNFHYLQLTAPVILLILTRLRVPISTTFMILTSFLAKSKNLGKSISKSLTGYGLSFGLSLAVYLPLCPYFIAYGNKHRGNFSPAFNVLQWGSTAVLWSFWL